MSHIHCPAGPCPRVASHKGLVDGFCERRRAAGLAFHTINIHDKRRDKESEVQTQGVLPTARSRWGLRRRHAVGGSGAPRGALTGRSAPSPFRAPRGEVIVGAAPSSKVRRCRGRADAGGGRDRGAGGMGLGAGPHVAPPASLQLRGTMSVARRSSPRPPKKNRPNPPKSSDFSWTAGELKQPGKPPARNQETGDARQVSTCAHLGRSYQRHTRAEILPGSL